MIKIKDVPLKIKIVNKHKKVYNALLIITYVPLVPFALLDIIVEKLDYLIQIIARLRIGIVDNLFKIIYRKEIISEQNTKKF